MSSYPHAIDSDQTIIRIDDNITEIGGEAINQLRDAVFAIEKELGLGLSGSVGTLAARVDVSINPNGTIKSSALANAGLVTLPIVDSHVASNAGIKEYKLSLDHSTSNLHTLITDNRSLLEAINVFASFINSNLEAHLEGATFLSNGEGSARHVASQVDLNSIPNDSRDLSFSWTGLTDKNGVLRSATQVAEALFQINNELIDHQNAQEDAHVASAITVDVSNFKEIPATANTVQKALDYLNQAEELNTGEHRATQHSNGIPIIARSQSFYDDGYGRDVVVPSTAVNAYLVNPPANAPVDSNTVGDNLIRFKPNNGNFIFDSYFSKVMIGDIVRINYGNGISSSFEVESIRYSPGVEWVVRINGSNLCNAVDGYVDGYAGEAFARIDRPQYDRNTYGVLALAAANSIPSNLYTDILSSVIVGHPRGAAVLGLGFDGNKLDSNHYKLWLQLYPSGNPADSVVNLPFIDVTGDAGASPGSYTLEKVVEATNNNFRKLGYNYRFISFQYRGDFGLMLADPYNKASFAIINGSNDTGTILTNTYTQNVVADATDGDGLDAFGFGARAAGVASPAYQSTFIDATAARNPTQVISPAKNRPYIVNGAKLDDFAPTYLANDDGYWPATITNKTSTGSSLEVTYRVDLNLSAAKLKPGKTIVVQPSVEFSDSLYSSNDYGRFIIKEVYFSQPCGESGAYTTITVLNGVHGTGSAISFTSEPGLEVRLYFSEDSVGFNDLNVIDEGATGINYHRFHEIYINDEGSTFSHERARMRSDQNEASPPTSLLRTDLWHITDVSPKLRGYQDDDNNFNKYIRFYVTRYDASSGEFDGYIGKRNNSNAAVSDIGPTVTSRKNVPTKFYDETYIDFIELEFKDTSVGPIGTSILSDNNPRYVDIELFPSLRLNPENFLLGSCEVNWRPNSGQSIIQNIRDLRDFGSIGINDFTNSTLEFLSVADKYIHENGVIRGLQYIPSGVTNTTGELSFTGGVALVNGRVVVVNNLSVMIPAISSGGSTGVDVRWAVCVNEHGYLTPIILTEDKEQFFAGSGSLYHVQSVTFEELINNRRNLTLIAIVDAHISSITIEDDDVYDARRFIIVEGFNHPFVLSSDENIGHFHNIEAVKIWLSYFNGKKNTVKVSGSFNLSESLDLTGFTSKVTIEGDGAIFNFTSSKGIIIGNNVTLRGLNFVYTPSGTYANYVSSDDGCIYALLDSDDLSNIVIENCNFSTQLSTSNRPPFISFQIQEGFLLSNIIIRDNTFTDETATSQAAIAIVHDLLGNDDNSAAVKDIFIERNLCNADQGIYVTSYANTINSTLTGSGLNTFNVHIKDNSCGKIGVINSLTENTSLESSNWVVIKNNKCKFIGSLEGYKGIIPAITTVPSYGIGNIIIDGNSCNWIQVLAQNLAASNQYSDLKIINNSLTANDNTFLNHLLLSGDGTIDDIAIRTMSSFGAVETNSFLISGNIINSGRYNGTSYSYYTAGISIASSSIVSNNIIKGLGGDPSGTLPIGIFINFGNSGFGTRHRIIEGNQIYREDQDLAFYILVVSPTSSDTGLIVNNFFDSPTVDGYDTDVISAPSNWIVEQNINQTVTLNLNEFDGIWCVVSSTGLDVLAGDTSVVANADGFVIFQRPGGSPRIYYTTAAFNNDRYVTWNLSLSQYVPKGAYVVGAEAELEAGPAPTATSSWSLSLKGDNLSTITDTDTIGTTATTLSVTSSSRAYISGKNNNISLVLTGIINSSNTATTDVLSMTVTYRW